MIAAGTAWATHVPAHGGFWADLAGPFFVAVAATVAASHAATLASTGRPPDAALTGGFHWAFWAGTAIALLAVPIGLAVPRRPALAEPVTAFALEPLDPRRLTDTTTGSTR